MHAGEIAFERGTAPELEPLTLVIFPERNTSAVQGPRALGAFLRMQFHAFAFHADRRRDDAAAIADGACAGHLVEDFLAAGIDLLRRHGPRRREHPNETERQEVFDKV